MIKPKNENIIYESIKPSEKVGAGFEMSLEQAVNITSELSKLNDTIDHDRPIKFEDIENIDQLARETEINVSGEIMTVEEAEKIPNLRINAQIWKEMRDGNFDNMVELTGITPNVSKYLENAKNIALCSLTSAHGLVLPKSVKGNLLLTNITSAKGLVLPTYVGGGLDLTSITSAKGLVLPRNIEGYLWLDALTSVDGLELPQSVGRDLTLSKLVSAKGLVLPEHVGKEIFLESITPAEKEELRRRYPQYNGQIL